MSEQIDRVVPILRIFDVDKAREFYVGFLGMTVDWEHRFEPKLPLYMQVSRGNLVLHLSEHHGDACPGSTVVVEARGLEAYHREITSKGYNYLRPGLEPAPWSDQMHWMQLTDPFGNRLRFIERRVPSPQA
jgi:catechol 2,3-dioxygenase-like lactoylglutathione lyase family enzyme